MLLFVIGLGKLVLLIPVIQEKEFMTLISLAIIFAALTVNLIFLSNDRLENEAVKDRRIVHDLLHIAGIGIIGICVSIIIPHTGSGFSTLAAALFLLLLSFVYKLRYPGLGRYFLTCGLTLFCCWQIRKFFPTMEIIDMRELPRRRLLQYGATLSVALALRFARDTEQTK